MSTTEAIAAISLVFNLLVLLFQTRVRADVTELKAQIYKDFVTKDDFFKLMEKQHATRR